MRLSINGFRGIDSGSRCIIHHLRIQSDLAVAVLTTHVAKVKGVLCKLDANVEGTVCKLDVNIIDFQPQDIIFFELWSGNSALALSKLCWHQLN